LNRNRDERLIDDALWLVKLAAGMFACLLLGITAWMLTSWIFGIVAALAGAWCLRTWMRR